MVAKPVPLRLDDAILVRLDRIAEALSARAAGARVSRAEATRIALERGAAQLEAELGIVPKKRK